VFLAGLCRWAACFTWLSGVFSVFINHLSEIIQKLRISVSSHLWSNNLSVRSVRHIRLCSWR
jgi:hypothetical protein